MTVESFHIVKRLVLVGDQDEVAPGEWTTVADPLFLAGSIVPLEFAMCNGQLAPTVCAPLLMTAHYTALEGCPERIRLSEHLSESLVVAAILGGEYVRSPLRRA